MKYFYVLQVIGDVEPELHGPYSTADRRDDMARIIRAGDTSDLKDGLYMLDLEMGLNIEVKGLRHTLAADSYSGAFFDDED